jgi:photosystem II stability/assembly factor-like uncharacterized protein
MTKSAAWRSVFVGAVVLLASAVPAPGQTVSFIARKDFPAGNQPRSAAVADFNGDGVADLATGNAGSDSVSVLLGNGDGTFRLPQVLAAGRVPWSVAAADFNGDRAPDLAVANSGTFNDPANTVSVLLANGDGTFQAPQSFAVGTRPLCVVAGDFNRDGIPDLATANSAGVAVLLGNGDGTFQPMRSVSAATSPYEIAIAVGDLSGDGVPDLAVTNFEAGDVSVLLGVGDGNFLLTQTVRTTAPHPYALAISDLNGDGVQDLAVANLGQGPARGDVSVLPGAGDGTFQPARHVAVDPIVRYSLAAGDLNGDGAIDLATPGGVLLGNGDATFQTARPFVTIDYPWFVVMGEFNADGKLDLAVQGVDAVSVLLGNGDGTFFGAPEIAVDNGDLASVAVGDFNADGVPDFAAATASRDPETLAWVGTISVLLGNGDGTFQPRQTFAAGNSPGVVTVNDFNRDGAPDLAVLNGNNPYSGWGGVSVLLGNGDGTFQAPLTLSIDCDAASVAVGDFNQDGALDLVVSNVSSQTITVLHGNGDGTFQAASTMHFGVDYLRLATGDFNRDGVPDLAVAHSAGGGRISTLLGNGDGTFRGIQTLTALYNPGVAVEDVNADSVVDLIVLKDGGISVLMGNGDGTFPASAETFSTSSYAYSLALGDFNGDRRPDVALPGGYGNDVQVLLGNGDGTLQAPATFRANRHPGSLAVSDLNHDGKADLVVVNGESDTISVLINDTAVLAHDLAVVKDGSGSGRVTSDPAGIDCGPDCSEPYASGTVVTLVAAADAGSIFAGWSGCDTMSDTTCIVTISEARSVTATFRESTGDHNLTVKDGSGSGRVTSDPAGIDCWLDCSETYASGTVVTLVAAADAGFILARWSGCDTVSDTTCTVTISGAKSVTATFTLERFMLTVTKDGTGSGSVASDPAVIACGPDCSETYAFDTVVTLLAAADADSILAGWSGCDTESDTTCTVTISEAKSVTATFTRQLFMLTVTTDGTGSGNVASDPAGISCDPNCSETYMSGTVVTLVAAASEGSRFSGWSGCDAVSGSTCVVTMWSARSLKATFRGLAADSGWFWQNPTPTSALTFDFLFGVSCADASTCTAVGDSGTIVRSADGGATWAAQSSGTGAHLRGVSCPDANTCTAVGNFRSVDGGAAMILRTTNGGATWAPQASGTISRLSGVSCPDLNTCTAVGGVDDVTSVWGTRATILRTADGGATWTLQSPSGDPNDPVPELFGVSFTDANTGTAVGAYSTILRTYQGGEDWEPQQPNTSQVVRSVSMTGVDTGMAAADGNILAATPPGSPWTPVSGDGALGISCTDAKTCTAVGAGDILHTTDGGATWIHHANLSSGTLFSVSCTDADSCTAVGASGTILRTNTGGR